MSVSPGVGPRASVSISIPLDDGGSADPAGTDSPPVAAESPRETSGSPVPITETRVFSKPTFQAPISTGLEGNWIACEGSIEAALDTPLTPNETIYLLCEKAYVQIQQGKYHDALASISQAREKESSSVHFPYLSYLEALVHFHLKEYTVAEQVLGDAPNSETSRITYYQQELRALIHLNLEKFTLVGNAIVQMRMAIAAEQKRTGPSETECATIGEDPLYIQTSREKTNDLTSRTNLIDKLCQLLINPGSYLSANHEQSDFASSLLYVYAQLLTSEAKNASPRFEQIEKDENAIPELLALYDYLRCFFTPDAEIEQSVGKTNPPLIFPMSQNELHFYRATLERSSGNYAKAIELLTTLRNALLPPSTIQHDDVEFPETLDNNPTRETAHLALLIFEIALQNRDLSYADAIMKFPVHQEDACNIRLLLCRIKLHFFQKKEIQPLLDANSSLIEKFPLIKLYQESRTLFLKLLQEPIVYLFTPTAILPGVPMDTTAQAKRIRFLYQNGKELLKASKEQPNRASRAPLRNSDFFLSRFETDPIQPLPSDVTLTTVETQLDELLRLALTRANEIPAELGNVRHDFYNALSLLLQSKYQDALAYLSATYPFLHDTPLAEVTSLGQVEQRLVYVQAFIAGQLGNLSLEDILLNRLSACKGSFAKDSIDYDEKIFCATLNDVRKGDFTQALAHIEQLRNSPFLSTKQITHLLAEKAYLLFLSGQTDQSVQQIQAIRAQTLDRETGAYLDYIEGCIVKARDGKQAAQTHFSKAIVSLNQSTDPVNKALSTLDVLKLLMYSEWIQCSVKLQDRTAIAARMNQIIAFYNHITNKTTYSTIDPFLYLANMGKETHFFAMRSQTNLHLSMGLEMIAACLLIGHNDQALEAVRATASSGPFPHEQQAQYDFLSAITQFNKGNASEAVKIIGQIRTSSLPEQMQKTVRYFSAFFQYCADQASYYNAAVVDRDLSDDPRYCPDIALPKLRAEFKKENAGDAKLQIDALLAKTDIPTDMQTYLQMVKAHLGELSAAQSRLDTIRSSVGNKSILSFYLYIIEAGIVFQNNDAAKARAIATNTDLKNVSPLLAANHHLASSRFFFAAQEFEQVNYMVLLGLIALRNSNEQQLAVDTEKSDCFFSYLAQRGSLPPCIDHKDQLAEALCDLGIASLRKMDGKAKEIVHLAQEALQLPHLQAPGEKRTSYLKHLIENAIASEQHMLAHREALELNERTDSSDPEKGKIQGWLDTIESKMVDSWTVADRIVEDDVKT